MCKNIFLKNKIWSFKSTEENLDGTIILYVRSKFSSVRSSHDLCARTHAHSLEGTL